jgi:hypothetical protein
MAMKTRLEVIFDSEADVLYISKGRPVLSHVDEKEDGLLLRLANTDGHPTGITALDFRDTWRNRESEFYARVADDLGVSTAAVRYEIERWF